MCREDLDRQPASQLPEILLVSTLEFLVSPLTVGCAPTRTNLASAIANPEPWSKGYVTAFATSCPEQPASLSVI